MYYPIMLDLKNKDVLMVGGGSVALRKAKNLVKAGANLKVVAPEIDDRFKELHNEIQLIYEEYNEKYLDEVCLVIGATSSKKVNRLVKKDAKSRNILVNLVDDKEASDFITPAIMENEGLQIAISSKGSFPTLSKYIRHDLESKYDKYDREYMEMLEELRILVLEKHFDNRRKIFSKALELNKDELKEYLDGFLDK